MIACAIIAAPRRQHVVVGSSAPRGFLNPCHDSTSRFASAFLLSTLLVDSRYGKFWNTRSFHQRWVWVSIEWQWRCWKANLATRNQTSSKFRSWETGFVVCWVLRLVSDMQWSEHFGMSELLRGVSILLLFESTTRGRNGHMLVSRFRCVQKSFVSELPGSCSGGVLGARVSQGGVPY